MATQTKNKFGKLVAIGIICVCVLLFAGVAPMGVKANKTRNYLPTGFPNNAPCASGLQSEQQWSDVHRDAAIRAAQSSQLFRSITSSYDEIIFSTSQMTGTWGADCVPVNATYNPVFAVYNLQRFKGWILVMEDPATLAVVGLSTQTDQKKLDLCGTSPCIQQIWAGYESGNTQFNLGCGCYVFDSVNYVESYYHQPYLQYPPTGCANYNTCNVGVWVGLEDQQFGYPDQKLAQAGTTAECAYNSFYNSCVPNYYHFTYDNYPAAAQDCANVSPGPTDQEYVSVTQGYYQGTTLEYEYYMDDVTNNNFCFVGLCQPVCYNSNTNLVSPNRADFMVENFPHCGPIDCDSLAVFSGDHGGWYGSCPSPCTTTFWVADFRDQTTGASVHVGSGNWIMQDNMANCGYSNVNTGSIGSSGVGGASQDQFSVQWSSSQGTPYWLPNYPQSHNC